MTLKINLAQKKTKLDLYYSLVVNVLMEFGKKKNASLPSHCVTVAYEICLCKSVCPIKPTQTVSRANREE